MLTLLACGGPAVGAECAGVTFAESLKVGPDQLVLNGLGLRTATILNVKVYVAGLYLPQKSEDPGNLLADRPWHLVIRYVRDVDAPTTRQALEEGLKIAAGEKFDSIRPRVEQISALTPDVKSGQYIAFTNEPAKGVTIDVAGGVAGGTIKGSDFATALLANWVGPRTQHPDLRTGLLGGPCE